MIPPPRTSALPPRPSALNNNYVYPPANTPHRNPPTRHRPNSTFLYREITPISRTRILFNFCIRRFLRITLSKIISAWEKDAQQNAQRYSSNADQNLLVHVLNGLLTAWNISKYLPQPLSEIEKYLLCLGLTLHDYNKYCNGQGEETPKNYEVAEIINICRNLGEKLNFQLFWSEWQEYLPEIAYLAQNTQNKVGTNIYPANWLFLK